MKDCVMGQCWCFHSAPGKHSSALFWCHIRVLKFIKITFWTLNFLLILANFSWLELMPTLCFAWPPVKRKQDDPLFFHNWSPEEKFVVQSAALCNAIPSWHPLPSSLCCKLQGIHHLAASLPWRLAVPVADKQYFHIAPSRPMSLAMETLNELKNCGGWVQL